MPKRSFTRHDDFLAVTDAQAGLITAAQLAELGVARSTVSRRTRPGGMWTRILPSVHLVTGGNPTTLQRELAGLLYCGQPSMLTGVCALRHHGLPARPREGASELVHLLVPHERRRASKGFVLVERTRHFPAPLAAQTSPPLTLAGPARALVDASRHFRDEGAVQTLVAEALRRGITDVATLMKELAEAPRQGSGHLRRVLATSALGAWSPPEADLLAVVEDAGLPRPLLNHRLFTRGGRFIAVPDAWFDDVGLAVEVDSLAHHAFGLDLQRTIQRNARYVREGIACLQVSPTDIRDRPHAVAHLLRDAYNAAARSARPDVVVAESTAIMPVVELPSRWAG